MQRHNQVSDIPSLTIDQDDIKSSWTNANQGNHYPDSHMTVKSGRRLLVSLMIVVVLTAGYVYWSFEQLENMKTGLNLNQDEIY